MRVRWLGKGVLRKKNEEVGKGLGIGSGCVLIDKDIHCRYKWPRLITVHIISYGFITEKEYISPPFSQGYVMILVN